MNGAISRHLARLARRSSCIDLLAAVDGSDMQAFTIDSQLLMMSIS